jgi:hypothetical protein
LDEGDNMHKDRLLDNWSEWQPFPDPRNNDYLYAPFGPGVYELRHKHTEELILFGRSKNVAYRVTSLLPRPLGRGTRRNDAKREYVQKNIEDIEYRTLACASEEEAKEVERQLKAEGGYKFTI